MIVETDEAGNKRVRFLPVPAWETADAVERSCAAYDEAVREGADPLLIIPMFILNFLCIHLFNDGNG